MDLTHKQHNILKQLQRTPGPLMQSALKPKISRADSEPLVAAGLVELGKQGRSATLALTDAGRRLLAERPEPPEKPKRAPRTPAPRPPKTPKPVPEFPFPGQRVFMLKLAFARPGEPVEGLSNALKAAERSRLVEQKWIRAEVVKRKLTCELTDAGWLWVEEHLRDDVGGSPAGDVLGAVLDRVGAFLAANGLRLADLLRTKAAGGPLAAADVTAPGDAAADDQAVPDKRSGGPGGDLTAAIQDACRRLARNAVSSHVLLADLRPALASWGREAVNAALLDLALAGRVKLVGMDDPREIQPRDREAALRTPAGETKHLLYWIGS